MKKSEAQIVAETRREWASAIARRIVDELSIEFEDEEAKQLQWALFIALENSPESIDTIIGTKVIEEGYFEPLD